MPIDETRRIYVAGHRGMVGSAVCRRLQSEQANVIVAGRDKLDLTEAKSVEAFFATHKPTDVVFAAARVGGILANKTYPVEFLADNMSMALNAIRAAHDSGVTRFLFLGSTCIYPRDSPQPIAEDALLTGPLEPTNEAYALAKIAGLKLCQFYRRQYGDLFHSAMPTNLYGPGDNYHPENSHVLPAMIKRFHDAAQKGIPSVTIWGTGTPRREFLHVDDLADALVHLLDIGEPPDWVNVGSGVDISILEVAKVVADTVGYKGEILNDPTRPDGTPLKCSSVARLHGLGWRHRIDLAKGLELTYASFLEETRSNTLRIA